MNPTQYQVDNGVAVVKGADIDYEGPTEFPCDECGGIVDLTTIITVRTFDMKDGVETVEKMTEAAARNLLRLADIPPPPVLCEKHPELAETFSWKT